MWPHALFTVQENLVSSLRLADVNARLKKIPVSFLIVGNYSTYTQVHAWVRKVMSVPIKQKLSPQASKSLSPAAGEIYLVNSIWTSPRGDQFWLRSYMPHLTGLWSSQLQSYQSQNGRSTEKTPKARWKAWDCNATKEVLPTTSTCESLQWSWSRIVSRTVQNVNNEDSLLTVDL